MSFTYDFNTAPQISTVRLLVSDTVESTAIWTDEEVMVALQIESSQGMYTSSQSNQSQVFVPPPVQIYSYYRSAALLLDTLAANNAKLASVVQLLDVKLDPAKAAEGLREIARGYRETEANRGQFAIAEMVTTTAGARERIWFQLERLFGGGW